MTIPPSFADGDGDVMKASLWGELQSFIDLSMIYAKLPLAPFFRLRLVCKEWNRLASDRQFLEENFQPPISSNPYFVLTRRSEGHVLLTSEGSSWSSTPVPPTRCEVSGLLFEDSDRNRVFDLHTRVFHTLPRAPPLPLREEDYCTHFWTGMTVDTTVIPYGFRVIIFDGFFGARIYDSNSGTWTHKPSAHKYYSVPAFGSVCVHYNKSLYIRVGGESWAGFDVHTYDLERDKWDCLKLGNRLDMWDFGDIGVWQDRWFVIAVKAGSVLTVREIHTHFEEPWSLFDCMPGDASEWINGLPFEKIYYKFCGEHVLVYNRVFGERAVLYNLDRKTWDKIELPATPMSP